MNPAQREANRRHVAAYRARQRAKGLRATRSDRMRRIVVEKKRDIFEVAALLAQALAPLDECAGNEGSHQALAAYRQYWEED